MIDFRIARIAFLAAALLLAGCDHRQQRPPRRPDLIAVAESAPYLCDLVPEQAFRRVTGLSIPLRGKWDGPQRGNGLCLAYASGREAPLGLDWSFNAGEQALRRQERMWEDNSSRKLPADLGRGLAVIRPTAGADPRPNFVIALFRCGKRQPWISIDFAPVVRGRDALTDLVGFIRIAEQRFGRLHKCAPKPS